MFDDLKEKAKTGSVKLLSKQVAKYAGIAEDKEEKLETILNEVVDEIGLTKLMFLSLKAKEVLALKKNA